MLPLRKISFRFKQINVNVFEKLYTAKRDSYGNDLCKNQNTEYLFYAVLVIFSELKYGEGVRRIVAFGDDNRGLKELHF